MHGIRTLFDEVDDAAVGADEGNAKNEADEDCADKNCVDKDCADKDCTDEDCADEGTTGSEIGVDDNECGTEVTVVCKIGVVERETEAVFNNGEW